MITYIIIFAISICLMAIAGECRKRGKDGLCISFVALSATTLVLLLALREGVGTDYYDVYVTEFDQFLDSGYSRFEFGFTFLMQLVQLVNGDYHLLLGICALLTVLFMYAAIVSYCKQWTIALYVACFGGFIFFATNGVRQSISISILMLSAVYLKKNMKLSYVGLVLLSATFHAYALAFLLLLPFSRCRKVDIRIVALVILAALLFAGPVSHAVVKIAGMLSPQIARYINNGNLAEQYLTGDFDFSDFLYCVLPLATSASMQYLAAREEAADLNKCSRGSKVSISIEASDLFLIVGLVACALTSGVALLSRFAAYCSPFAMLTMGNVSAQLFEKHSPQRLPVLIYLVVVFGLCLFLFGWRNFSSVIPYNTWLL